MKQEDGTHHKMVTVAVAMHKDYELPNDDIYLPIHVGAELHPDILPNLQQDNDGYNTSSLNLYFSELTALYWLWKNKALRDLAPSYLESWERLFHKRSANIFTMMVMDRKTFDAYCAWLSPLLFEPTKRLDPTQYTPFHARYSGHISELLLSVRLDSNGIRPGEPDTTFPSPINWWVRGIGFLKAKFTGKNIRKTSINY
mgnify:CR=1 FL=1